MAIKVSPGKLTVSAPFESFISEQIRLNNIELLPFSLPQIAAVVTLPFHHRDPFDRLLVAQALTENLPLVSRDKTLDAYGMKRLW